MKFVARNLETAGRDQGRTRPDPHDPLLRHAVRRAFGAAGAGEGRSPRPQSQRQRRRAASAAPMGGRRRRPRVPQEYRLRDLVAALDKAKDDSRVKAVALDLDGFTGGGARRRSAISPTPSGGSGHAGKPVIAYGVGYTNDSYALASAASEIWLNPLGGVLIIGPGRLEPLLQGPARQARGHRQRLSRWHLQVGGRALHPQRHVARGASRITWRSTRRGSKPGSRRSSRRGPRPTSTCSSPT